MTSWKFHAGFWRAAALSFACAPLLCPVSGAAAEHDAAIPKVAVIYTVATPELKEGVERAIREEFGGKVDILRYEDAAVFGETAKAGKVGRESAARFLDMYADAARSGAGAVLSVCSTVADLAYSMRGVGELAGVPIVGINDEMCREAVRSGKRILVRLLSRAQSVRPEGRYCARARSSAGRSKFRKWSQAAGSVPTPGLLRSCLPKNCAAPRSLRIS